MLALNYFSIFLFLIFPFDRVLSKGTVRFGSARVLIAQQEEDHEGGSLSIGDTASGTYEDSFNLRLYIPTRSEAQPSPGFEKFASGAGKAFLINSASANALYFAPEGYIYDEEWVATTHVCNADVRASQLRSDRWQFADPQQLLTVYYLCDYHCCKAECCQLNYSLICILGLLVITLFSMLAWAIWLKYHRCCLPRPFDVAVSRLLGTKVAGHYRVRLTKDFDIIATKAPTTYPMVLSYHSKKVPLC